MQLPQPHDEAGHPRVTLARCCLDELGPETGRQRPDEAVEVWDTEFLECPLKDEVVVDREHLKRQVVVRSRGPCSELQRRGQVGRDDVQRRNDLPTDRAVQLLRPGTCQAVDGVGALDQCRDAPHPTQSLLEGATGQLLGEQPALRRDQPGQHSGLQPCDVREPRRPRRARTEEHAHVPRAACEFGAQAVCECLDVVVRHDRTLCPVCPGGRKGARWRRA